MYKLRRLLKTATLLMGCECFNVRLHRVVITSVISKKKKYSIIDLLEFFMSMLCNRISRFVDGNEVKLLYDSSSVMSFKHD